MPASMPSRRKRRASECSLGGQIWTRSSTSQRTTSTTGASSEFQFDIAPCQGMALPLTQAASHHESSSAMWLERREALCSNAARLCREHVTEYLNLALLSMRSEDQKSRLPPETRPAKMAKDATTIGINTIATYDTDYSSAPLYPLRMDAM